MALLFGVDAQFDALGFGRVVTEHLGKFRPTTNLRRRIRYELRGIDGVLDAGDDFLTSNSRDLAVLLDFHLEGGLYAWIHLHLARSQLELTITGFARGYGSGVTTGAVLHELELLRR